MVHYFPSNGRRHYGPGSSRQRHNDRGDPSSKSIFASIVHKSTLLYFIDGGQKHYAEDVFQIALAFWTSFIWNNGIAKTSE